MNDIAVAALIWVALSVTFVALWAWMLRDRRRHGGN